MLTDAAKAQMDELAARNGNPWTDSMTLVHSDFGTRLLTDDIALVEIGCKVWTDVAKKRSAHDEPLGGLVVQATWRTTVDDETGEVISRRIFRTLDPYLLNRPRVAFRTVHEDEVDRSAMEGPDIHQITRAVRQCAQHLAAETGPLDRHSAELAGAIFHLTAAILAGVL